MGAGEVRGPDDWFAASDGTWQKCPMNLVGTRIDKDELDRDAVWARPVTMEEDDTLAITLGNRLATVEASMGSMARLR